MEWRDEGLIIGIRRHGETSVILEAMTRAHGRHLGLVKGGRSRRMQPLLQPGNAVDLQWRARLEEHLGNYTVETTKLRAARLMQSAAALHALDMVGAHLRLIAERDPHPTLYDFVDTLLDRLDDVAEAPSLLVRFELAILADLGFGLDLDACAATGVREDLVYVSPKSGRAVSRGAGAPYAGRLLPLPAFLQADEARAGMPADVVDGFRLTEFFLMRDLFGPRGLTLPPSRAAYVAAVGRAAGQVCSGSA